MFSTLNRWVFTGESCSTEKRVSKTAEASHNLFTLTSWDTDEYFRSTPNLEKDQLGTYHQIARVQLQTEWSHTGVHICHEPNGDLRKRRRNNAPIAFWIHVQLIDCSIGWLIDWFYDAFFFRPYLVWEPCFYPCFHDNHRLRTTGWYDDGWAEIRQLETTRKRYK